MSHAIAIEGLSKAYGGRLVLDHLDLTVEPGEMFGFLGPNGAGKTTTIRLLLDLIRPTSGRASVLGHDCHAESKMVRAETGYLPGDVRLYPNLTGRQTVDLFSELRCPVADACHGYELAERFDLPLDQHVGTYSKGTRQKLGLVLALLSKPQVLLLDEPTSGLDPILQAIVWDVLRAEAARGTVVFFSSHVMSEVEHVCERVAILRRGRLVAVEPIAALKARSLRRIEATFADTTPLPRLGLPGVEEVDRHPHSITWDVRGPVDGLVKALADYRLVDLRSEQPSLDEILLRYYEEQAA